MQSLHPIFEPTFVFKAHSGTNTCKNRPLCSHCNILGHTKDKRYKLIRYPPGYNSKNWSSSNSSRGKGSQVVHTNYMLQTASSLDIPTTSINTTMQEPSSSDWEGLASSRTLLAADSQQDKFSARALPAIFLGYPPGVKGTFFPRVVHDMVDASHVHEIEQDGSVSIPQPSPGPTDSNDDASPGPTELNDDASLHIYHDSQSPFEHSLFTRGPDIVHTVLLLSQFVSSPRLPHMTALKHLLAYIKSSLDLGLFFPKQAVVSRSSCEVEYRAMDMSTCELVWLVSLLSSFHVVIDYARLYCDNQVAISLGTNQVFHERTKHIEVDCHFVRDMVKSQKSNLSVSKPLHISSIESIEKGKKPVFQCEAYEADKSQPIEAAAVEVKSEAAKRKVLNAYPYSWLTSTLSLACGSLMMLISWATRIDETPKTDFEFWKTLFPVVVAHTIGHVAQLFFLGDTFPPSVYLSLVPIIDGCALAAVTELDFNITGFMRAMISNLAFVFRNIFSKKGMKGKSVSGMNYYACLSLMSLLILVPFSVAIEGPQVWVAVWQKVLSEIGPQFVW
ncbi:Glucose-6-phosphate/phosphate translocator 2 [Hibiscus syriacus]|uniref:Glucose-6-phosphate/phosphate translocator 2 n=1 Tax=Hibiscus syriacus TaxID=106335 RepID=A0A6A3CYJ7_HIBSY|nr:Glucose-6-phosphate/phosphate translocator 2 [Hibiscus syriacus]